MTFREKLADWISGGELSRQRKSAEILSSLCNEESDRKWKYCDRARDYKVALHQIAEQETPSANATVKRMARIAREALK
jgi:hypothetical protein